MLMWVEPLHQQGRPCRSQYRFPYPQNNSSAALMFRSAWMQTASLSSNTIRALFLKRDAECPCASLAYLAKHATYIESKVLPSGRLMK